MFRDIWTAFEKTTSIFNEELDKANNTTIILKDKDLTERILTGGSVFTNFPADFVPPNTSDRVKLAMLYNGACSEPFTTGLSLLRLFIKGKSKI